jgi:uncharacterized damage-inducible protein DinB
MAIKDMLLPEFEVEIAKTRRLLERVPLDDPKWKPHPKSMDMGNLTAHIVEILDWATVAAGGPSFDMAADPRAARPTYATTAELLSVFDAKAAQAKAAIAGMSDAEMMSHWSLLRGEAVMMKIPKLSLLRGFVFSHIVHHRGQASVYLRLKDIPVPAIYGPSADESAM